MAVVSFKDRNFIGLAGEFRVMSELLMRKFNLAKSYLQDGYDILLESGIKIEVKSSHRYEKNKKYYSKRVIKGRNYSNSTRVSGYNFTFRSANKKGKILKNFDFAVCWCINDDVFYVIPVTEINGGGIHVTDLSENSEHKFTKYRNNWEQLRRA